MRILYLVHREGLSAIFSSMVLEPIAALGRGGVDVHLAVLTPVGELIRRQGRARWREVAAEAREQLGVQMTLLPSPPSRTPSIWRETFVVRQWVAHRLKGWQGRVVMHCRGPRAASLGLTMRALFPQLRTVWDMRGISFAENMLVRGLGDPGDSVTGLDAEAHEVYELEKQVACNSDGVVCVASGAGNWVHDRFGVPTDRIRVILNSVNLSRFHDVVRSRDQVRRQIGAAGRFVICYCGSLREWQQHERGIDLFRLLKREMPAVFFLGLTTSPDRLQALLQEARIDTCDYAVMQVPYSRVGQYLAAADLGLITRGLARAPRLEDRLSCPVKCAEYLAAGTPVAIGPDIGDCSRIVNDEHVGLVLSPFEPQIERTITNYLPQVAAHRERLARRCQDVAYQYYDLAKAAKRLSDFYRVLASGPVTAVPA